MAVFKRKEFNLSEPILYGSYIDKVPPGSRSGPQLREAYIVECNESGYGSIIINGREFPVKPRNCYILLPGQITTYTADKIDPRKGVYCTLGGLRVGQILAEAGINSENPFVHPDVFDEITSAVYKMIAMQADTDRGAELRRVACIYEILAAVKRRSAVSDSELFVEKALGIFETEYDKKITVSDIAARIGFDRSYFSTFFKERLGISPYSYLTSLRVTKAGHLLENSDYSVSDIAECVGLDPVNFSRIFKRVTGKSPLDYKKEKKNRDKHV